MNLLSEFNRLCFHEHLVLDEEISHIVTNDDTVIEDIQSFLLLDIEPGFLEFMSECIFIYLFQKPAT